ncbi:unnamed protein product, partial [Laminaria digitata]
VRRTGACQPTQKHGTWYSRRGKHDTFLLAACLCCSRSSTFISQTATTLVSRRDKRCGCATSQLRGESSKALVVDTIATTRSQRLVVMPVRRAGVGSGAQQAAQVVLLTWQIDTALALLLFSAYQNACCLPRSAETRRDANPDASFGRGC